MIPESSRLKLSPVFPRRACYRNQEGNASRLMFVVLESVKIGMFLYDSLHLWMEIGGSNCSSCQLCIVRNDLKRIVVSTVIRGKSYRLKKVKNRGIILL